MNAFLVIIIIVIFVALAYNFQITDMVRLKRAAAPKLGGDEFEFLGYDAGSQIKFLKSAPRLGEILKSAATLRTYDQIPERMPYTRAKEFAKTTLHNGQLKLFLTELEFLTKFAASEEAICIYAGSAPSNKIYFLSEMFPKTRFILIDPHEHYIMYPGHKDQYDSKNMTDCMYFKAMQATRFAPKNARVQVWRDGAAAVINRRECVGEFPRDVREIMAASACRFYIYEDFYTNEVSEILRGLSGNVLFVSDIRSQSESEGSPKDIDILWNSAMMYNWLEILQPKAFMLKFRCPYDITPASIANVKKEYAAATYTHADFAACKIKFIENFEASKFVYIDALAYIQAFAGVSSTESRLIGTSLATKEWDCGDYNDRFFYYNRIYRPYGFHAAQTDGKIGIDHCGDCGIMSKLFDDYFAASKRENSTKEYIERLHRVIHRSLYDIKYAHGLYTRQLREGEIYESVFTDLANLFAIYIKRTSPRHFPLTVADACAIYAAHFALGEPAFSREFALLTYYDIADKHFKSYIENTRWCAFTSAKIIAAFVKSKAPAPKIVGGNIVCGRVKLELPYDTKGLSVNRLFIAANPILRGGVLDIVDVGLGDYIARCGFAKIVVITASALQTVFIPAEADIIHLNLAEDDIWRADLRSKNTLYVFWLALCPEALQMWCRRQLATGEYNTISLEAGGTHTLKARKYDGSETMYECSVVTQNLGKYVE